MVTTRSQSNTRQQNKRNNQKNNKTNTTHTTTQTTQTIQTLAMVYNDDNNIDNCILLLDLQNSQLSRSNTFISTLKILVKNAEKYSQNENKLSSQTLDTLLNCYRFMNYYMSNYNNEIANISSLARYKLFDISYKKALKNRNVIMQNSDNTFTRKDCEEANKVFTEYINIWMLNEYKWFPLEWRNEKNI